MTESRKDTPLRLLQITDSHLHAAADSRMRGVRTYATLLSVLQHARADARWPADAILATGDIVQDESRAGYERFRETVEPLGVPVLSIPGNHDDPTLMAEVLSGGRFQVGGELRHGAWSIVMLSTFLAGEDSGGLGPARLEGLRKSLAAHVGQHVLVAMHHHALPVGSTWLDGVALRDSRAFLNVIDSFSNVRVILSGHVHQAADQQRSRRATPGGDRQQQRDRYRGIIGVTLLQAERARHHVEHELGVPHDRQRHRGSSLRQGR